MFFLFFFCWCFLCVCFVGFYVSVCVSVLTHNLLEKTIGLKLADYHIAYIPSHLNLHENVKLSILLC